MAEIDINGHVELWMIQEIQILIFGTTLLGIWLKTWAYGYKNVPTNVDLLLALERLRWRHKSWWKELWDCPQSVCQIS